MPTRDRAKDLCPGALQVHLAADGGVARIRLPGGRLTASQLRAVLDAAARLGDGTVELTSRANLQVRGLAPGTESALAGRLAGAGLLPSATHERVRNIIASPLAGRDGAGVAEVRDLVEALDEALCARPALARLPGRFLFTVDDGRGDVAWLDADVAALFVTPDTAAVLLGDADVGLRAGRADLAALMLDCAEAFLELREDHWRIAELDFGPARIAEHLGVAVKTGPAIGTQPPTRHGPLGVLDQTDGLVSIGVAVPLGWLDRDRGAALARAGTDLVITPWRGAILTDLPVSALDAALTGLRAAGFLLDPAQPGVGVSACTGKPGCAKALADVRADAAAMLEHPSGSPMPVHWSGCGRRCGRPRGRVLDVVATEGGYLVGAQDRPVPAAIAVGLAARGRTVR
ncbi:MAG: precorrin-3B synthase [Labedaea sp.]